MPSGTEVFDWTVPPEWNVREAWIEDAAGRRLVDLANHPLHVLGYSEAVDRRLSGAELQAHLYSLPELPDLIPARTSYWERRWGFSLQDRVRREIRDEDVYHVRIDATHDDGGSLTYAEAVVPGTTADEILLSTYTCHPGLANDGVSGIVAAGAPRQVTSAREVSRACTVQLLLAQRRRSARSHGLLPMKSDSGASVAESVRLRARRSRPADRRSSAPGAVSSTDRPRPSSLVVSQPARWLDTPVPAVGNR